MVSKFVAEVLIEQSPASFDQELSSGYVSFDQELRSGNASLYDDKELNYVQTCIYPS